MPEKEKRGGTGKEKRREVPASMNEKRGEKKPTS